MKIMVLTLHVRSVETKRSDPLMKEEILQDTGKGLLQPIIKREQGKTTYNRGFLFHFYIHLFIYFCLRIYSKQNVG